MEKEEAIEFILRELENNHSQDEIVSMLSQELGAPQQIVENFVARVLAENPPAPAQTQPPTPQALPHTEPQSIESLEQAEEINITSPFVEQVRSEIPTPVIPASQAHVAKPPAQIVQPSSVNQTTSATFQQLQLDEEIEKIILKGLSKNHRMDDIVMEVCDRKDLDWKQAQRMVAQVQAKNRKRLTSRRNAFLIPLAFIMVAAGLVLLWASGSEIQILADALLERDFSNPAIYNLEETVRIAPAYFVTGLILVLGGIVGMFTALRSQQS